MFINARHVHLLGCKTITILRYVYIRCTLAARVELSALIQVILR